MCHYVSPDHRSMVLIKMQAHKSAQLHMRLQHYIHPYHCTGTVTIIAVTIPPRWRKTISVSSNCAGFWAMHWEIGPVSCVLYGYVDALRIGPWISYAVAHLTPKMIYFVSSAMIVTDNPGTWQMIVTAIHGDSNWHTGIVTDWIYQDWLQWDCWTRASQSLPPDCNLIILNVSLHFGSPYRPRYVHKAYLSWTAADEPLWITWPYWPVTEFVTLSW